MWQVLHKYLVNERQNEAAVIIPFYSQKDQDTET